MSAITADVQYSLRAGKMPFAGVKIRESSPVGSVSGLFAALRTETGLMGNCPTDVRKGDLIYVLEGGTHPFVLRREPEKGENAFKLICERRMCMGSWTERRSQKSTHPQRGEKDRRAPAELLNDKCF